MILDPNKLQDDRPVLDTFPKLRYHPEFHQDFLYLDPSRVKETDEETGEEFDATDLYSHLDQDMVHRFVLWAFSLGAKDLHREDLQERKFQALVRAGFKPAKHGWLPEHLALANLEISGVNSLVTRVLRVERSREFAMWASNVEAFYQVQQELRTPVYGLEDDKKMRAYELKLKLSKESISLEENISKMEEKLFLNDEGLIEEAQNAIGTDKSDFAAGWAERMATNIR